MNSVCIRFCFMTSKILKIHHLTNTILSYFNFFITIVGFSINYTCIIQYDSSNN